MRTRLDYARIYYRMSTYLQALTCLLSQVLAIACFIYVRGVCNEEKQHKCGGVMRNILSISTLKQIQLYKRNTVFKR